MGLSLLLLALVLFGASQGALKISFDALFDEEYRDIWLNIRLPRVLLAVLVGAALATAGVIMQGLFRNPMADPGLLGVSSGSALMVGVAIVLPFSFPVVLVLYEQMVARQQSLHNYSHWRCSVSGKPFLCRGSRCDHAAQPDD